MSNYTSRSFLSFADSAAFRGVLRDLRKEKAWSLHATAAHLGCSRKTAWNHLQPDCKTLVRSDYAEKLAKLVVGEAPWVPSSRPAHGVNAILKAWAAAEEAAQRRRVAWRLAAFISELTTTSYKLPSVAAVSVSAAFEPVTLSAVVCVPRTSITGTIIVHFHCTSRESLELLFQEPRGKVTFNGRLSAAELTRMHNKIQSWQRAQH